MLPRGKGREAFTKNKASRGTTLVRLKTPVSLVGNKSDKPHLERGNGREPGAFSKRWCLTPNPVQDTCSEGRVHTVCCRLAPGDGSLKTNGRGLCPRHCIYKIYLKLCGCGREYTRRFAGCQGFGQKFSKTRPSAKMSRSSLPRPDPGFACGSCKKRPAGGRAGQARGQAGSQ